MSQIKKTNKSLSSSSKFIFKLIALYLGIQLSYDYILSPYTPIDNVLIDSIIELSEKLLLLLGYDLLPSNSIYEHHLGIADTTGVVIGNPCDGLSLFILFTSFIIVFRGKWWSKTLFVLAGIMLIHLVNILRIVALAVIVKYAPDTLDFHHSYTFTLIVYLFIFSLWVLRIKFFKKHRL